MVNIINKISPVFNQTTDGIPIRLTTDWKINEYIIKCLVCVCVPLIIASNTMVLLSVAKFKRLQIPTNYFMTSLAVADIVVALALPFYVVTELMPIHLYDDYVCLASNRVLTSASGVSILTLAIIAFDRYTAITNPLEYILMMTSRKIIGYILFSWIYSAMVSWIPVFVGWYRKIEDNSYLCTSYAFDSKSDLLFLCALFVPACICILFCYIRIYHVARHHARAIAAMENNFKTHIEQHFRRKDTKYAKKLAVLIGIFLFLWLPYQSCLFLKIINCDLASHWIKVYFTLLAYLNSGVNPWAYAYQSSDFRAAYKKIWESWKCSCHNKVDVENRRDCVISVVPNSLIRLNRTNSRIIASDVLYALSQYVGVESTGHTLARRMSSKHIVLNAVSSLPELLKLYANTYPGRPSDILEESIHEEPKVQAESRDSACSLTEYIRPNGGCSPGGYSFPVVVHGN